MRRLVMWLVAVGVSVSLAGCSFMTGEEKKAPAKPTTATKAATSAPATK
jgi:uncharacterized lipoprotein YbaY